MTLLAKSDPPISLQEHIDDCLKIYNHLKGCFPQVSEILAGFDFWEVLRLAVITHDLGKGHKEFIEVLSKRKNNWQGQRHELFSLPFIEALPVNDGVRQLLKLIVAAHHKDIQILYNDYVAQTYSNGKTDEFGDEGLLSYLDEFEKVHVDEVLKLLNDVYGINLTDCKPQLPHKFILTFLRRAYSGDYNSANTDYFKLLLLFGALKHCDHLGSARFDQLEKLDHQSFAFLKRQRNTLQEIGLDFYSHQSVCSQTIGNAILTAPTGSGKTESAMLWLETQVHHYGQGRTFYILPFTASINAMYERLSSEKAGIGTDKVGMLHGKLQDYLYDYLDNVQYVSSTKKEEIGKVKDKFKTIYTPLKVVTPFQLLKHLYGLKGFEQGIFEWVGGYFIFDEIHAYSPEVFAQIKVLLEYIVNHLKGKVFVMTATMPSFLKRELEQAIGSFTPITADEQLYQKFDRHRIIVREGLLKDNFSLIEADLKDGKKVLVVCNTVVQAQKAFSHLRQNSGHSVLLHSAFTGEDRTIHERQLKKGEHDAEKPIQLLVGTQAIEVSLDIDYDVIYTEPAPIDSLIQRFGRVNRKRSKGICPVVVFGEANEHDRFIYNQEIVARTIEVLKTIAYSVDSIIKERKLQEYIDRVYPSWDEKSEKHFRGMYDALKYTSECQLIPLLYSTKQEDDFYKQFDGIKVLPVKLKEQYENYLSSYDFIGAERLKVQIRKNKFAQLISENDQNLYKTSYVFLSEKGKLIEIPYWVLTKRYDPELGLIYSEQEEWKTEMI